MAQWTLHAVKIQENQTSKIAIQISRSLDPKHHQAWYADFKNYTHDYNIFSNKIFFIDRRQQAQYDEAKRYGISLGISAYQVDFHPEISFKS